MTGDIVESLAFLASSTIGLAPSLVAQTLLSFANFNLYTITTTTIIIINPTAAPKPAPRKVFQESV